MNLSRLLVGPLCAARSLIHLPSPLCVGGGSLAVIAAICIAIFIARKKRSPAAGGVVMSGVALSTTAETTV